MQSTSPFLAPRRHALLAGLAVSVLLHALLLFYLRLPTATPVAPDRRAWTQLLTVRLLPPAPPPQAAAPTPPAAPPERTTRPRLTAPAAVAAAPRPAPADAIAPPKEPAAATARQEEPQGEPQLDLHAARATARAVAKDLPTSDNWAADKLARQKAPEDTESERLGKNIARSARPDCRNGEGGLLAPLIWLMDKKDSGCKF